MKCSNKLPNRWPESFFNVGSNLLANCWRLRQCALEIGGGEIQHWTVSMRGGGDHGEYIFLNSSTVTLLFSQSQQQAHTYLECRLWKPTLGALDSPGCHNHSRITSLPHSYILHSTLHFPHNIFISTHVHQKKTEKKHLSTNSKCLGRVSILPWALRPPPPPGDQLQKPWFRQRRSPLCWPNSIVLSYLSGFGPIVWLGNEWCLWPQFQILFSWRISNFVGC